MLAAAFLDAVEAATGKRIADHFDLVAGTSTGGIIALGLGLGLPAREIVEFYVREGPRIFDQADATGANGIVQRWSAHVSGYVKARLFAAMPTTAEGAPGSVAALRTAVRCRWGLAGVQDRCGFCDRRAGRAGWNRGIAATTGRAATR